MAWQWIISSDRLFQKWRVTARENRGSHSAPFKEEIFMQGVDERAFMFKIP